MIDRFPGKNAFVSVKPFVPTHSLVNAFSDQPVIKDLAHDECHIGLVANDDIETYASIFALWLGRKKHMFLLHPNQPLGRCAGNNQTR